MSAALKAPLAVSPLIKVSNCYTPPPVCSSLH